MLRGRWTSRVLLLTVALVAGGPSWCGGRPFSLKNMVFIQTAAGGYFIDMYEYPNEAGKPPRHETHLGHARKACAAEGKRLCTDYEWRRACNGPAAKNKFGYGPTYEPGYCNSGQTITSGHSGLPMDRQLITKSGAKKTCRSAEGVYDLVGNVEEWVLTDWNGNDGMLEGGAWFTIPRYASCSGAYSRQPHYRVNPKVLVYSAGFRCCWSYQAPTEADLTPAAKAKDTRQRLAAARKLTTREFYDPNGVVQVYPGLWIDRFEYPNRVGEFPMVGRSWNEANKLCRAAGKRLCTATEWQRACGGEKMRLYSYDQAYVPEMCGVNISRPVVTGGHHGCVSPVGAVDMVGGVWEWTATKVPMPPGTFKKGTVLRAVRGGSWYSDPNDGVCRPTLGYTSVPQTAVFEDVGFRCCKGKQRAEVLHADKGRLKCPNGMASIRDFCIDRYEHPNQKGKVPQVEVDFPTAVKACKGRGLHVCTESEWLYACEGSDRRRYPYGDTYEVKRCRHGLVGFGDANPAFPSGHYRRCVTPDGVFDMSGNTWEWTVSTDGTAILRGGGTNVVAGFGNCRCQAKSKPSFHSFETGTRCCATAEEAKAIVAKQLPPPPR